MVEPTYESSKDKVRVVWVKSDETRIRSARIFARREADVSEVANGAIVLQSDVIRTSSLIRRSKKETPSSAELREREEDNLQLLKSGRVSKANESIVDYLNRLALGGKSSEDLERIFTAMAIRRGMSWMKVREDPLLFDAIDFFALHEDTFTAIYSTIADLHYIEADDSSPWGIGQVFSNGSPLLNMQATAWVRDFAANIAKRVAQLHSRNPERKTDLESFAVRREPNPSVFFAQFGRLTQEERQYVGRLGYECLAAEVCSIARVMAVKYERDTAWDRMVGFADRWVQASLACRDHRAALNGGVVYRDLGEIEKARDCIVKALDMADDDASRQKAYRLLGVLEYDAGSFEKTIPYYVKALAINPHDAGVLRTLGISHLQLGDKQACLTYLRRYLALDKARIASEPSDRYEGVKGVVNLLEKEMSDAKNDQSK